MTDHRKAPKRSRDYLDDPEAFKIANWRLHNSGDDNKKPTEEVEQAKKHGPGLMRAAGKAFDSIDGKSTDTKS